MTPATDYYAKGASVEEWTDVHFFRPVGLRITRLIANTPISPDHVTVVAFVIGIAAGHLFFYDSVALNALGVALFIVSDIFDSVDGQLARMRGTSTRFGRILDGLSDSFRFINLYCNLGARLIVAGHTPWLMVLFVCAAGIAHMYQSTSVDFIKQVYLHIAGNGHGEVDLPEDLDGIHAVGTVHRLEVRWLYRPYVARYSRLLPTSIAVIRRIRAGGADPRFGQAWARAEQPVVRQTVWIAQNIRFALLAVTVVPGWPAAFLWVTLVPMSLILIALQRTHERRAATLLVEGFPRLAEAA